MTNTNKVRARILSFGNKTFSVADFKDIRNVCTILRKLENRDEIELTDQKLFGGNGRPMHVYKVGKNIIEQVEEGNYAPEVNMMRGLRDVFPEFFTAPMLSGSVRNIVKLS